MMLHLHKLRFVALSYDQYTTPVPGSTLKPVFKAGTNEFDLSSMPAFFSTIYEDCILICFLFCAFEHAFGMFIRGISAENGPCGQIAETPENVEKRTDPGLSGTCSFVVKAVRCILVSEIEISIFKPFYDLIVALIVGFYKFLNIVCIGRYRFSSDRHPTIKGGSGIPKPPFSNQQLLYTVPPIILSAVESAITPVPPIIKSLKASLSEKYFTA